MLICSGAGKLLSTTVVECLSRNSMVLRNDLKRSMILVLDVFNRNRDTTLDGLNTLIGQVVCRLDVTTILVLHCNVVCITTDA